MFDFEEIAMVSELIDTLRIAGVPFFFIAIGGLVIHSLALIVDSMTKGDLAKYSWKVETTSTTTTTRKQRLGEEISTDDAKAKKKEEETLKRYSNPSRGGKK